MMKLLTIAIITCVLAGCGADNSYKSKSGGGYGYYQSTNSAYMMPSASPE